MLANTCPMTTGPGFLTLALQLPFEFA